MNAGDDWSRWTHTWQQEPAVDVDRLRRQVRRKRLRMRAFMALRVVGAIFVIAQLARLQLVPGIPVPMRVWGGVMSPLFALIFYMRVRQYRGTWDVASESTADLLRLTEKRARAGIRLAWANISAIVLVSVVSLAFAAPYFVSARWQQDLHLRQTLVSLIVFNGIIAVAALVLNVWYMHRQRARLQRIDTLLTDTTDADNYP